MEAKQYVTKPSKWITEEIKEKFKNISETKENRNITVKNIRVVLFPILCFCSFGIESIPQIGKSFQFIALIMGMRVTKFSAYSQAHSLIKQVIKDVTDVMNIKKRKIMK